jgi:hypothetical protein
MSHSGALQASRWITQRKLHQKRTDLLLHILHGVLFLRQGYRLPWHTFHFHPVGRSILFPQFSLFPFFVTFIEKDYLVEAQRWQRGAVKIPWSAGKFKICIFCFSCIKFVFSQSHQQLCDPSQSCLCPRRLWISVPFFSSSNPSNYRAEAVYCAADGCVTNLCQVYLLPVFVNLMHGGNKTIPLLH